MNQPKENKQKENSGKEENRAKTANHANEQKTSSSKKTNRNRLSVSNILAVKKQNEILHGLATEDSMSIFENEDLTESYLNHSRNKGKENSPNKEDKKNKCIIKNKYLDAPLDDEKSSNQNDKNQRGKATETAGKTSDVSDDENKKSKTKKVIKRPDLQKKKPKPAPPKEDPPLRRSRKSSNCSSSLASETISLSTNPGKEELHSSLHEPYESPQKRARRSPLKRRDDEIAIKIDVSDSEEEEERNTKRRPIIGPYFTESTSGEFKKRGRPTPIIVDSRPRSREARKVNDELKRRDEMAPADNFILSCDEKCLNRTSGKYIPPNWSIQVKKVESPNDAVFMHKIQSIYSMSSILNGLKKA